MRILMLVMTDITGDARVMREARSLGAAGHEVTIIGWRRPERVPNAGAPQLELRWVERARQRRGGSSVARWRRFARWMLLPTHRRRSIQRFQRQVWRVARGLDFDVVHAHDYSALGAGTRLAAARRAPLVYDAHECWAGRRLEGRPTPLGRLLDSLRERRLGGRAAVRITVSPGIAEWMRRRYGWSDVRVIRNTFPRLETAPDRPRAPRGLVYAGRLDTKRDLATVIKAARELGDLPICLVGPADDAALSALDTRGVSIMPAKPADEIPDLYRRWGMALVSLDDRSLNHRLALPNKLFHAVQAGVPVVAADLPELHRIVSTYGIGTLYRPGDVSSLVAAVHALMAGYGRFRDAVSAAAPELSWERDEAVLLSCYEELVPEGRR